MTVKEYSQKYGIPEETIWGFIKDLSDTAEKPFVKDENKNYPEDAMTNFLTIMLCCFTWKNVKNGGADGLGNFLGK